MFKKNLLLLAVLLVFSYGCGYSPTFKNLNNKNFKIETEEINGDNLINSYITSKLKVYSNNNGEDLYKISILTNYEKKDLSKDKTGKITNYELKFRVEFEVSSKIKNKKIIFEENFILNNLDDAYNNYQNENLTKKDFANIAVEKLIEELLFFK